MSATSSVHGAPPNDLALDPPGWRVGVSVLSVFGLASFLLLFAAFWAGAYSMLQDLVVTLVALLVFVGINGSAWAPWGMRHSGGGSG
jgi:hypothetical protein